MKLRTDFKIVYVPLPPEMIEIRRAGLLLLLQWIKEDLLANPEPLEELNANRRPLGHDWQEVGGRSDNGIDSINERD